MDEITTPAALPQPKRTERPIERRAARTMGLLSLLPLYLLVVTGALLPEPSPGRSATFLLAVAYTVALLAFLGAIHWGAALAAAPNAAQGRQALQWGAVPVVLGAMALALTAFGASPALVLALLAIDLALCLAADAALARASGMLPDWFLPLRRRWTAGAIVALALAIAVHA